MSFTRIENAWDARIASDSSIAFTVKLKFPDTRGVPWSSPDDDMDIPSGNPVADHDVGAVPVEVIDTGS